MIMNRLKFYQLSEQIQSTKIMVYSGGFVTVNHLIDEKLYIIIDIKSGTCLKYIKMTNKKKNMLELKNYLKNLGVKFQVERRKVI